MTLSTHSLVNNQGRKTTPPWHSWNQGTPQILQPFSHAVLCISRATSFLHTHKHTTLVSKGGLAVTSGGGRSISRFNYNVSFTSSINKGSSSAVLQLISRRKGFHNFGKVDSLAKLVLILLQPAALEYTISRKFYCCCPWWTNSHLLETWQQLNSSKYFNRNRIHPSCKKMRELFWSRDHTEDGQKNFNCVAYPCGGSSIYASDDGRRWLSECYSIATLYQYFLYSY